MPPFRRPSSKKNWIFGGIGALILGGILFLVFFQKAEITISLKKESIPVDVVATSTGDTAATGTLPYKVLAVQKESSTDVTATGAPVQVDKKASGTIVVYNNYSSAPQSLIATTRFETPDGLVYRIDTDITVPGTKTVNGQTVPGSVEAVVYADAAGEKYNIGKSDFKIPGFKGGPKYDGFYARSKTDMTGGFSGMVAQISDGELQATNAALEASLRTQALEDLKAQKPGDHVMFEKGIRLTYTSTLAPSSEGKTAVKGKVSGEALIFPKANIDNLLANSGAGFYHFDNLESLDLAIQNEGNTSFISLPPLAIRLSGTLTTGESFDTGALQKALAGKSKVQLPEILKMYPEISKAEAVLHPFWKSSFPENAEKIKVTVTK